MTEPVSTISAAMLALFAQFAADERAVNCMELEQLPALQRAADLVVSSAQAQYPRTPIWSGYAYQCALVSFRVNADGAVDETSPRIVSSFPLGKLDRSALKALTQFRFKPPQETEKTYLWLFDVDAEKD